LVINGCHKVDKLEVPGVLVNPITMQEIFFSNNAPVNPLVKAMNMFLQRQNDTLKYVEKTVKQIGYPIWNKAIIFSKKTSSGRGSSIGDSTDIIYIPFVRENQNYVNATMIVQASPNDTNFSYICDWEYSQRQYGLNNADSSAEHTAAFFMLFDKEVFGHTEFKITDADLFADHPMDSQSLTRTVYLTDSTSTHGRASN